MATNDSLAPLRSANFRWYFASRLVNTFGNAMATVALAFAVLDVSDDAAALGWVLAAHTIPMVALLLYGGVLADRFSKATVLQVSNATSALSQGLIAALVISGRAEVWQLVTLSALHGAVSGVGFPAMAAMMPSLVPREHLQPANALVSLTRSGMAVLGPSLGALLVVQVGSGWALAVDASMWALSALFLLRVRLPAAPASGDESPSSPWADLREGWTWVRSTRWFAVVVLGFGALNAIQSGAMGVVAPVVAQETIGRQAYGWVLSAEAAGFVVTTLVLLRFRLERPLLSGMIGIGLVALPMVALGLDPALVVILVAAVAAGMGTELFGMGWNLAMQENVPEDTLSRAYSYDALGSFLAMPIGQLAWGPLGQAVGMSNLLVASGVAYLALTVLVLSSRSVRTLPRRTSTP